MMQEADSTQTSPFKQTIQRDVAPLFGQNERAQRARFEQNEAGAVLPSAMEYAGDGIFYHFRIAYNQLLLLRL